MRSIVIALLVLAAALGAAWHVGALAPLRPILQGVGVSWPGLGGQVGGSASTGPAGVRKCVAGERVLYTDAACPPGYVAATVQGHVTVVAPVVAAPAPASTPRTGATAEGTLRDQMIDRAVNR